MADLSRRAPIWLAGIMGTVGGLHFVAPARFAATIPPALPYKKELVLASGVVEVACAVGLAKRVPLAGRVAALTLLAVWPANLQMALDAPPGKVKAVMWARLPLQLPMIWAALQGARPPAA